MRALITGVSGQDGYYLTKYLLQKGYVVIGLTSNYDASIRTLSDIAANNFILQPFDYLTPLEFKKVINNYNPDIIFNFASKATGVGMYESPYTISRLNGEFVVDILEAIRTSENSSAIRFCQASSSEMYGDVYESPQTESTPFRPISPYGAAKLYAHNMVKIYREKYGLKSCSAILYNHESIRRTTNFVTRKIAKAAVQIKTGECSKLKLGNLDAKRDWGYAPEYIEAMYLMAKSNKIKDYIVSTGKLTTVRELCEIAFGYLNLDYTNYVEVDSRNIRDLDTKDLLGDNTNIKRDLSWKPRMNIKDIMIELVKYELRESIE